MSKSPRIALVAFENEISWGLRSIGEFLRLNGYQVTFYFLERYKNIPVGIPDETIARFVEIFAPQSGDVVGVSFTTPYYDAFVQLAQKIKSSGAVLIAGGIHPTIQPEACLPFADYIIRGSGDLAFLELLNSFEHGDPPPKGVFLENNEVWFTENVNDIPYPQYGKFDDIVIINGAEIKTKEVPRKVGFVTRYQTFTSFGCPYACSYCVNILLQRMTGRHGKKFLRRRSIDHVINELKDVKSRIDTVSFEDEDFLVDEERISTFLDIYQKEINLPFTCLVTPRTLKEHSIDSLVSCLKKAQCVSVTIGLQSASPKTAKVFCRPFSLDQLKLVANAFSKHRILVRYDIILSNPFENADDVDHTVHAVLDLPHPYEVNIFHLTFFPGYDITLKAQEMHIPIQTGGDTRRSFGFEDIPEKIIRLAEIPYLSRSYLKKLYEQKDQAWAQKRINVLSKALLPYWNNRIVTILRIVFSQPALLWGILLKKFHNIFS